jgi:hypothetical protein
MLISPQANRSSHNIALPKYAIQVQLKMCIFPSYFLFARPHLHATMQYVIRHKNQHTSRMLPTHPPPKILLPYLTDDGSIDLDLAFC